MRCGFETGPDGPVKVVTQRFGVPTGLAGGFEPDCCFILLVLQLASNYVFEFSSYRNMIHMWNVQCDAQLHLPFSDLWSDQYLLTHCEIKPIITPKWPGIQCNSTRIDPIANWTTEDESAPQTAYFTYRLCYNTMWTPILNCRKKWWLVGGVFCMETRCNGPEPNWEFGLIAYTSSK